MKKLVIGLAICLIIAGCREPARAEVNLPELIKKIPELNQAVIFSLADSEWQYATSITLVELLNDKIKLDIGYTPKQEIIGLVSVKLVEVKNYLNYPILRWVTLEPFVYIGWDRISGINANQKGNSEYDFGIGAKILAVKF